MATPRFAAFVIAGWLAAPASANPRPADACAILPRPVMQVRLTVNSARVDDAARIRQIVNEVWEPEGLRLEWLTGEPARNDWDRVSAWIVVSDAPVNPSMPKAIGGVAFGGDGAPARLIRLSVDAAQHWAVATEARRLQGHSGRALLRNPVPIPLTTQLLGYAAAHELGHFVLASKSHADSGLMRASYAHSATLTHREMALDATSRQRLRARLAASELCGGLSSSERVQGLVNGGARVADSALSVCVILSPQLSLSQRATALLLTEVAAIWQPLGVAVRHVPEQDDTCQRVIVVKAEHEARPEDVARDEALGWVPFVAGRARQVIFLRVARARLMIDGLSPGTTRPEGLTELLQARLLGRSLAHELGHILLNDARHAKSGLMRPQYRAAELLAVPVTSYSLNPSERARLFGEMPSATRRAQR